MVERSSHVIGLWSWRVLPVSVWVSSHRNLQNRSVGDRQLPLYQELAHMVVNRHWRIDVTRDRMRMSETRYMVDVLERPDSDGLDTKG